MAAAREKTAPASVETEKVKRIAKLGVSSSLLERPSSLPSLREPATTADSADSLATLIGDDTRLKSTETAQDAYAEAWALTYFLLKRHPQQYVEYLKRLSTKKPLLWDEPEARLAEFKQVFGKDLQKLDTELVRTMARQR